MDVARKALHLFGTAQLQQGGGRLLAEHWKDLLQDAQWTGDGRPHPEEQRNQHRSPDEGRHKQVIYGGRVGGRLSGRALDGPYEQQQHAEHERAEHQRTRDDPAPSHRLPWTSCICSAITTSRRGAAPGTSLALHTP